MCTVNFDDFIKAMELEIIYRGEDPEFDLKSSDVNRPGLQFAGFFSYFPVDRIQVLGMVEMTYLNEMDPKVRKTHLDDFFKYDIPCVIIARNLNVPQYIIDAAKKYKRPVFRSKKTTTAIIHKLIMYLDSQLAPRITRHGVLVDVYGVGVLLQGESGIGKSETALELIKRGHRLIADDAVNIKKVAENRLIGESPELIKHFMEIRGIGIIDIKAMYGAGSVIDNKAIDLVINLENWDENKEYDRLGLTEDFTEILDVSIPKIDIPVRPGRNLAIIVEVAARHLKLKEMGYHAAKELDNRLTTMLEKSSNN